MHAKITQVEIIPVKMPLNEPFIISKGPLYHATITIVKIYIDPTNYGIGECCPYRTIHTETQEGSVAQGKLIADLIMGQDPREIRRLLKMIDKMIVGHASIKAAFDMALYDLNAKLAGLPLYKYLNGDSSKRITTNMTVSLMEAEAMVNKAQQYVDEGFKTLKLKLGQRPSQLDVDRVIKVRKKVGEDISLSIDANQGWNYSEALHALQNMEGLNVKYCEAPIYSTNQLHLQELRQKSPVLIMGDETVFNHFDAFQMLSKGCIDLINIKLGKSGGICTAMKIAAIAESYGVDCQVGCFSESRLGISALVHFAMAWDNIIYYDLDSPLMHSIDPINGGLQYHRDKSVTLDEAPGIGADFDPNFLKKFSSIKIS